MSNSTRMTASAARQKVRHAALCAFLLGAVGSATAVAAGAQDRGTLFRNARVFDGERTLERRDVLVQGGVIARVGQGIAAPPGVAVVDASGRTLLPGFIDAHTHTFNVEALREAAVFGVTTHLDMFTDHRFARGMREEQRAGTATGRADLFSAGTLVTAPRGHGTQFGMPIPTITVADSAAAFVDARIAEGSEWIKVVYDSGHTYGMRLATIDAATMRAVIAAAHRRGKLAVVHVGDAASARTAIESGADGLVHLFTDRAADPGFAELVRARRAFVIPTLTVMMSITGTGGGAPLADDARLSPLLLPASAQNLKQGFPRMPGAPATSFAVAEQTVRELRAAGVRLLAGTDAPNPGTWFGVAMHRELELLVRAGLTPTEALSAATSAGADAFRQPDRGRIARGKRADLLLVDGDPTKDITATRAIVGVWKSGVRIDRDTYMRTVAEAKAAAGRAPTVPADGMISTFEGGMSAAMGSWAASADGMAGGTSTGQVAAVPGGARGSAQSLEISGTVTATVPYAWYGAMWSPGAQPMSPVDLSRRQGLAFWTQGDGNVYRIMIFTRSKGATPIVRNFTASPQWQEVTVSWSDLAIDGSDVMGVVLAGGPKPGPMRFRIDDVRLR